MVSAILDGEPDPLRSRDVGEELCARPTLRAHLQVPAGDAAAPEQRAAQICPTAAGSSDDPLRRALERRQPHAHHAGLVKHLQRARLLGDVQLVPGLPTEGSPTIAPDLAGNAEPPQEAERPARDGRARKVEVERHGTATPEVNPSGRVEERRQLREAVALASGCDPGQLVANVVGERHARRIYNPPVSRPWILRPPAPVNEPVRDYAPGSPEREALRRRLDEMQRERLDIPSIIGGEEVRTGDTFEAVMPHDKDHVLADVHKGGEKEVEQAIQAAGEAWADWHRWPWEERAAVFLRAAELLAGPWRATLNAATMLNQSKTAHQAEIDSAVEVIDFWRYNVEFMLRIYAEQPVSPPGTWNQMEYRPLEGFVFAVTPFNFTAIAANLPSSPALMGNAIVWKPASSAAFSAYWLMRLLEEAGLPPGVINLVYGGGATIGNAALASEHLAGVHFTGSTPVFQSMWKTIGNNIAGYRSYPRIVGETGGKDFIVAHPSADVDAVATAIIRGSFEYQGQKCSAASRIYAPSNLWPELRDRLVREVSTIRMGDVADFSNYMGAVIDAKAFAGHKEAIESASENGAEVVVGGGTDDSEGYFIEPTVLETSDPRSKLMQEELFGPIVTTYVYPERKWDETLELVDSTAPYGLTGAVFSEDRAAIEDAHEKLRYAAGNFYVNDKPTGAVVGQQPFGGARASGTNDKAGSMWNLIRWVSPRTIKETFVPPTDYRYPFMAPDGDRRDGSS
jgi:1-pyrroline-5-carboxylate dehydrogenase